MPDRASKSLRLAAVASLSLALGACATGEEGGFGISMPQRAVSPVAVTGPDPVVTDPAPKDRVRLAREAQLQTPLRLDPEVTGAPPASEGDTIMQVDQNKLAAAGVDIAPDTRVWVRQGGTTVQRYGPPQGSGGAVEALTPAVQVAPR